MSRFGWRLGPVTAIGILALTSCSDGTTPAPALVPTQVAMIEGTSIAPAPGVLFVADAAGGRIDAADVDSLIVHVTRVEVLPESLLTVCYPPVGDSAHGFRPLRPDSSGVGLPPQPPACMRHRYGPMGPGLGMGFGGERFAFRHMHGDSLRPDSGWGRRADQWYTLAVVGDGRLDLVNLPAAGLALASGDLPPGDYGAARLFVADATIWFNTAIVTDSGVTLQPDTGYTVKLPGMVGRIGIATGESFTIGEGGGTVTLVFDTEATLANVTVSDSGQVVLHPVMRARFGRR